MATYDDVAICNMALDRIGIGQPIDDLAETNDTARTVNRWYAKCRDKVFSLSCMPIARKSVDLALVEEDPDDGEKWPYSYRYPVDCLRVLRLINGLRVDTQPIEWETGQDNTGRLIYTDAENARAEYLHLFSDTGEWNDLLADAVAALLGSEIAIPLGQGQGMADRCLALYSQAKAAASARAQAEGFLRRPRCSYLTARGTYEDRRQWMRT